MTPLEHCILRRLDYNEHGDCSVIAVALTCRVDYDLAHVAMRAAGRKPRRGAFHEQIRKAVKSLGKEPQKYLIIRKPNGSKYTPKTIGKAYPQGRYLVYTRGHVFALVNGEVQDWTAGKKNHILGIQRVKES